MNETVYRLEYRLILNGTPLNWVKIPDIHWSKESADKQIEQVRRSLQSNNTDQYSEWRITEWELVGKQ